MSTGETYQNFKNKWLVKLTLVERSLTSEVNNKNELYEFRKSSKKFLQSSKIGKFGTREKLLK